MTDLHERLTAAVRARMELARAASGDHRGTTPTGEHWRWECSACDTVIAITDVVILDEFLACPKCKSWGAGLRSIEEYPTHSVGNLPHMVLGGCEETRPVDAAFLAANDPATIMRHCERDLRVLERHAPRMDVVGPPEKSVTYVWCSVCSVLGTDYDDYGYEIAYPCPDIVLLAAAYGVEVDG